MRATFSIHPFRAVRAANAHCAGRASRAHAPRPPPPSIRGAALRISFHNRTGLALAHTKARLRLRQVAGLGVWFGRSERTQQHLTSDTVSTSASPYAHPCITNIQRLVPRRSVRREYLVQSPLCGLPATSSVPEGEARSGEGCARRRNRACVPRFVPLHHSCGVSVAQKRHPATWTGCLCREGGADR